MSGRFPVVIYRLIIARFGCRVAAVSSKGYVMEHSNDNQLTLERAKQIIADNERREIQQAFEDEQRARRKFGRWANPIIAVCCIGILLSVDIPLVRGFFWVFLIVVIANLSLLNWRKK